VERRLVDDLAEEDGLDRVDLRLEPFERRGQLISYAPFDMDLVTRRFGSLTGCSA
jgi:hypothetical protein